MPFPENAEDIQMFIDDDPCSVEHFESAAPTVVAHTFTGRLVPFTARTSPQGALGSRALSLVERGWVIICLPQVFTVGSDDVLRVTWQSNVYTLKLIDLARLPVHWEVIVSEHG